MSVRENIELYGLQSTESFVEVLNSEFGAVKHPNQADAYVVEQQLSMRLGRLTTISQF